MSVCWGATVTLSPVCTPIGSTFSIEQTITTLSCEVAHDLELELAPAEHRLVEQHLADGRRGQAARDDALELLLGAGDAAAAPAEGEGGAHDGGQPESRAATPRASPSEVAIALRGIVSPAASIVWRNRSRSSARAMAS